MTLTVGSLFSGIGGLDLGLERAGMTVRWQSEIDPYASRVLAKHWPDVPNLGDITKIDWEAVEHVDLICGGYPCQPFSLAGARNGEADPRHLWPWMLESIRALRPRYALLENVPGHLSLGFDRVLGDLAEIGFDAEWDCIPAAYVGAPHIRYRIFVVAYANDSGLQRCGAEHGLRTDSRQGEVGGSGNDAGAPEMADPKGQSFRPRLREGASPRIRWGRSGDGSSTRDAWTTEPDVGRVAHGIPHRMDRLRALGNAVVPQVAEHIGRTIVAEHEGPGS